MTGKSIDSELGVLEDEFVFFDEYVKGPMKIQSPISYFILPRGSAASWQIKKIPANFFMTI